MNYVKASMNSADASDNVRMQGLSLPDIPREEVPSLPRDITSLSDEDLMELFVALTAWNDYTAVQVVFAQVDERDSQRALDMAEARATAANWTGGKEDRVAITKAKVASDPDSAAARERLDYRHAYRKLVEAIAANLERDAAIVSRELTRRTSSSPITRRSSRWSP